MIYQEHFCEKCVHWNEEHGCPCWNAHEVWNYDECNNEASVLHRMIPLDGTENGQCIFYVAGKGGKQ
jgi:hypothetical protein